MKSILDDIIEYGESKGGLTLDEYYDLAIKTGERRIWEVYSHGKQLQSLLREIIARKWDESIEGEEILDAREWIAERRNREAQLWLKENWGCTIKVNQSPRQVIAISRVEWELVGSETPDVYREAGFDFEIMPTLLHREFDPNTGEIYYTDRRYIASGDAFDKVIGDYKKIAAEFFPKVRELDPKFPRFTRSAPLVFDPKADDFPDMEHSDIRYLIDVGRISNDVNKRLNGLTATGKPRKRLLAAGFKAATGKRNTEMKASIGYGPKGVVSSARCRLDTKRGHWDIYLEADKNGSLQFHQVIKEVLGGKNEGFYVLYDATGKLKTRIGKPEPYSYW